jgi:hypothetical protein
MRLAPEKPEPRSPAQLSTWSVSRFVPSSSSISIPPKAYCPRFCHIFRCWTSDPVSLVHTSWDLVANPDQSHPPTGATTPKLSSMTTPVRDALIARLPWLARHLSHSGIVQRQLALYNDW